MKQFMLIALLLPFLFSSCKKDDPQPQEQPETVLDYMPLQVGNYWIYERSKCDSTWTNCEFQSTDTCTVTKDTTINNQKYFKIEGVGVVGQKTAWYLRDSLNYIVNQAGNILISNTDFEIRFGEEHVVSPPDDTIYHWYRQCYDHPNNVIVPAGQFDCLDNRMSFYRKNENFEKEYNTHQYYAKSTGLVYENIMFASSTSGYKRELKGYFIEAKSSQLQP